MPNPKPYVFISHSSKDKDFTLYLADHLHAAGFETWVDVDSIPDGSTWARVIQSAVENCGALVVVMSRQARDSEWVERETLLAMNLRKPIFIALVDDTPLPIYLINRQHTDFRLRPQQAAKRLVAAIQKVSLTEPLPEPRKRTEQARLSPDPNQHNFFKYLQQLPNGEANARVARELYDWACSEADSVVFRGRLTPNFRAQVSVKGGDVTVFSVWAYTRQPAAEIPLQYLQSVPPYDQKQLRLSVLDALNKLTPNGKGFNDEKANLRPSLPLAETLQTPDALASFKEIAAEIVDNLRGD